MLFIMPMSLFQFGQKQRQVRNGAIRDAMLKKAPDTFRVRQFAVGAALAAVWVVMWLIVFLS